MIRAFNGKEPVIKKDVFIAETAVVVGDVTLEEGASVWYGAVVRGDGDSIYVGKNTNIQDNTVVHMDEGLKVTIGEGVTIGHQCIIHGCTIEDNCLIGMGAIVMNGAKIGKNSIVGAGALVTEGKEFPPNSLIIGSPARVKAEVTKEQAETLIKFSAEHYLKKAKQYR